MPSNLEIDHVPLDRLRPDPGNPRQIRTERREALRRSIDDFDFMQPIIARRADGTVIAGHQRLVAARQLGHSTIPVVWLDLSPERAQLLGVALNNEFGVWDEDLLARRLAELADLPGLDLAQAAFETSDLQAILQRFASAEKRGQVEYFDFDAALAEASRQPRAKPGDVWRLGDHRLLCGDATIPNDVNRLIAGGTIAMCFTDPPYNVDLGNHGGRQRGAKRRTMANDALGPDAWDAFLRPAARNILAVVGGAIYICMSSQELPTLSRILFEEGGHWSDTIVWAKDRFVLGRADYMRAYERIWYGWRGEGGTRQWHGGRKQSDVWNIARPSDSPLHPSTKPLELIERAIDNSSQSGDSVLDPFVGSGSTLIACERLGRAGRAIEINPVLVDVAIRRWERFSGGVAERIDA